MNKAIKIEKISERKNELVDDILKGKIFIYPTDTIYGIGCNALVKESVEKIRKFKGRDSDKPLSVIAPSKEWIYENLTASPEKVNKYLPGKYTLILRKKNLKFLDYASNQETLGVRIPLHKFTKIIERAEVPFITTSVNLSGENPIKSIKEIKPEILNNVDVIIDAGEIEGNPSTIILEDGKELKR